MDKKVVIEISLLEESVEVANEDITKEILDALSEETTIPWMKRVEKVAIVEE